jgi:hypothetical protein
VINRLWRQRIAHHQTTRPRCDHRSRSACVVDRRPFLDILADSARGQTNCRRRIARRCGALGRLRAPDTAPARLPTVAASTGYSSVLLMTR